MHDRLDRRPHVLLRDERHLEIELIELAGRAVGAAVLVAKAGGDLKVAVEAGHHQQLLELLWRLGQRIELPGMQPARHEVVARALGRAGREDRRRELREALGDHAAADARDHAAAQQHVTMQRLPPQVEEAVSQPRLLGEFGVAVHLQRQRLGPRLHGQLPHGHLDLAGGQLRVDRRRLARDDGAGHGDDALHPQRLGRRERGTAGVEDTLGQAVMVAQIDEEQAAVVALAVNPTRQPHGAADVARTQLAARMGAVRRQRGAHRACALRTSGFTSGRPPRSSTAACPQKPWVMRSSSCFFTFFRLTSKDTR